MKSSTKQPTVRVNQVAKQKLDKIQAQTDMSQPALLDRAIDLLERDLLAQQLAADFADLGANEKLLRSYQGLSQIFDGASADGLKRE